MYWGGIVLTIESRGQSEIIVTAINGSARMVVDFTLYRYIKLGIYKVTKHNRIFECDHNVVKFQICRVGCKPDIT